MKYIGMSINSQNRKNRNRSKAMNTPIIALIRINSIP
jgi:hypothetical protein